MKKAQSIILHGSNLKCSNMHKINIILRKENRTIIRGFVYDENNEPVMGAAVEVKESNCFTGKFTVLGYCFTNYKGEYVFCVQPKVGMHYEISIYSPLSIY